MAKERVFAVIGLGSFGKKICEVLSGKGGKVIAIDNHPQVIESIKNTVTQAVLLDSTDEESLQAMPLEDVDVAVVAIGDNVEASILTTAILKGMGIPYIISRSVSELHHRVLRQVGADQVLNIELDQGEILANKLISPDVLDKVPISKTISMTEIYAPEKVVGKTPAELDLRKNDHINIVAIKRNSLSIDGTGNALQGEDIVFPGPNESIQESDILIVLGKNEDIEAFREE